MEAEFLDLCSQKERREEVKAFCLNQTASERQRANQFRAWL